MKTLKRAIALALCLAMVLSIVGCGQGETAQTTTAPSEEAQKHHFPLEPIDPEQLPTDDTDRESLEQIADLVSGGSLDSDDIAQMDDEELGGMIADMLENSGVTDDSSAAGEFTDREGIAEDGSLEQPFDQVFPEFIEEELVEFDDETLLLKIANSRGPVITDAMAAAGVARLDAIVPLDTATWYEAKLVAGTDVTAAVTALRQLDEIIMVDYNYQIQTSAMAAYQEIPEEMLGNAQASEQWYLNYCGIGSAYDEMDYPGGSSSVIVAVIDTGVDYDHEDLADNIWVNEAEIPDNGIDDDGNGYVDDYYGVDLVAGQGSGDDDNGHGTHVAGIIAAQNNNLGIVGIAYNVQIMPIKAAMASGYLNQADIAEAIMYAFNNGAEVINMSFGGTACSIAVQDALAAAYGQCVLVASAGNDGAPNEGLLAIPNYPAALSYVVGVMSVNNQGVESGFTNYDVALFNSVEYELYAPGEGILSTIPGDRYATWSGTSMAAPVVSAMAAILRSEYADRNTYPTKFIYGQLTATSNDTAACLSPEVHDIHNVPNIVNLYAALTTLPRPDVGMSDHYLFDTEGFDYDEANANNGDGVIDAGETIALGLTLRNRWGMSENTIVTIDTLSAAGIADPYITIHNPSVDYGSVGTYSTTDCGRIYTDEILTGWENPFYITISEDCPNDYMFKLNVTVSCENALDEEDTSLYTSTGTILLEVRNGYVLPSFITEDMTLTPDNLYIIPNSTIIEEGVTVTVEPGTHIQFWGNDREDPYADNYIAYLKVKGNFLVNGTAEDPVIIAPSELMSQYNVAITSTESGYASLVYADVTNFSNIHEVNQVDYAYGTVFRMNYEGYMRYRYLQNGTVEDSNGGIRTGYIGRLENCVFYKIKAPDPWSLPDIDEGSTAKNCIFVDCAMDLSGLISTGCVFLGNYDGDPFSDEEDESSVYRYPEYTTYFAPDTNSTNIFYRPETGTTYITVYSQDVWDFDSEISARKRQMHAYVQALGGDFAAINDEEELSWLNQVLPAGGMYYDLDIHYAAEQSRYIFGDGTSLTGLSCAPEGFSGSTLHLYNGAIQSIDSNEGTIYTLYEIPGPIYLTDIRLSEYEILMDPETTYQLKVTSDPVTVPADQLIFESSDESILTVSETGLITPVATGTADVTVCSFDRVVRNHVTVHVLDYKALEGVSFAQSSLEVAIGQTLDADCVFTPVDTTRKNLTYTSSDESIATVDYLGRVTGVGSGTATITAVSAETDENGQPITAQLQVTVYNRATSLQLSETAIMTSLSQLTLELPQAIASQGAETDLVWTSTDPEVAVIEDGVLKLLSSGTTSIVVVDNRSGLHAICTVYVSRYDHSPVVDVLDGDDCRHYALLENGDLYFWSDSTTGPQLLLEDVAFFDADNVDVLACLTDNILVDENGNVISTGMNKAIIDVAISDSCFYIVTEDHAAYAWCRYANSDNSNGRLGIGTYESVTTPTLVNLDDVVDVESTEGMTVFLTGSGELYYAGTNQNVATPTLLLSDVDQIRVSKRDYSCPFAVLQEGWIYNISRYGSVYENCTTAGYDSVSLNPHGYHLGIRDGQVWDVSTGEQIPGIDNAAAVFANGEDGYGYILTDDGLLYGIGSNNTSRNPFANTTNETTVTTPVLIPLANLGGEESITLTGSNLNGSVLLDDALILSFSKPIRTAGARLYADGEQVTVTAEIINNHQLKLTRAGGFDPDVTYQLVIPSGGLVGTTLTNTDEITVDFVSSLRIVSWTTVKLSEGEAHLTKLLNVDDLDALDLEWYVTDESIATVQDGNLTPLACGTTTVRVTDRISGSSDLLDVVVWDGEELTYDESIHAVDEVITMESHNIPEDGILLENAVKVKFSKEVNTDSTIQLRMNGVLVDAEFVTGGECDELWVRPVDGFQEDAAYTLTVFPTGDNGLMGDMEYDLSFTWKEVFQLPDPLPVHKTVTDDSIERFYWTSGSFSTHIDELHQELNLNGRFFGNVLLNRISTDFEVANWLRPQAGGSDYTIPFGGNYWATVNETAIGLQIIDQSDFSSYGQLDYAPFLTEAPENVFPFVTGVTIYNKAGEPITTVSNEEITVKITFNRDMDVNENLTVTFGSYYPFADYTIPGEFVDARTWQGSILLTTVIENGYQYFSIGGGMSAQDGLKQYTDWGRFFFELDTTAAQALIMQGYATDTGISLSWTQDDFDTLMGYNVYRSTSEDGYYQRLNETVIPADTREFFDDTVEPGVVYYYNFTVVQTDLTESEPSGKISIMSLDTMAPNIYHSPVYTAPMGTNLIISATVTDNLSVHTVRVYYRTVGQSQWNTAVMNNLNSKYSAIIPASQLSTKGLEYYIEATDGISYTYKGSADDPYTVTITAAMDESSLGDVNGDGKISTLDALMLLQAINDLLNLDADQFARADLNGDGVLTAAEALRILHYVSGKVGSLDMD